MKLTQITKAVTKRLLSYFPSNLPVGIQEFETFSLDIISLLGVGLEKVPKDDIQFMISSEIMRLAPQTNKISKNFFVKTIRKYAANQVAGHIFTSIKEKQKAEATAAVSQASDEKTTQL